MTQPTDRERALVEASRPFARADRVIASHFPDGSAQMILTYLPGSIEVFPLSCLDALQSALTQYQEQP